MEGSLHYLSGALERASLGCGATVALGTPRAHLLAHARGVPVMLRGFGFERAIELGPPCILLSYDCVVGYAQGKLTTKQHFLGEETT